MGVGRVEWIDMGAILTDGEVQMRELGSAGKSNEAKRLTYFDGVAAGHRNRALGQVAILRLPAISMVQNEAISAILAVWKAVDPRVWDGISGAQDGAGCGGEDGDVLGHGCEVRQANVGASVTIVSLRPATKILRAGAGITVHRLLDKARLTQGAFNGKM